MFLSLRMLKEIYRMVARLVPGGKQHGKGLRLQPECGATGVYESWTHTRCVSGENPQFTWCTQTSPHLSTEACSREQCCQLRSVELSAPSTCCWWPQLRPTMDSSSGSVLNK